MRHKGIEFIAPMVKAALAKEKSMVRLVLAPKPIIDVHGMWHWKDCQWMNGGIEFPKSGVDDYAPFHPGDVLWVKETFGGEATPAGVIYKADYNEGELPLAEGVKWKPPSLMTEDLSRIFMCVTDVRVEQLHQISEMDAIKEGAENYPLPSQRRKSWNNCQVLGYCSDCKNFDPVRGIVAEFCAGYIWGGEEPRFRPNTGCSLGFKLRDDAAYEPARFRFSYLWDEICGEKYWLNNWNRNPFVWVISFVYVDKESVL